MNAHLSIAQACIKFKQRQRQIEQVIEVIRVLIMQKRLILYGSMIRKCFKLEKDIWNCWIEKKIRSRMENARRQEAESFPGASHWYRTCNFFLKHKASLVRKKKISFYFYKLFPIVLAG